MKCRIHITPRTSDYLGYLANKDLNRLLRKYASLRGKFMLRFMPEQKLKDCWTYAKWLTIVMKSLAESQQGTGFVSGAAAATKAFRIFTYLNREMVRRNIKDQRNNEPKED